MNDKNIDDVVIELLKAQKLPVEGLYKSNGGTQPITAIQALLDEDEGFPIPDYFIIYKGSRDDKKGEYNERKDMSAMYFNRFIEMFVCRFHDRTLDMSCLFEDGANWDALREDGFKKIYPFEEKKQEF